MIGGEKIHQKDPFKKQGFILNVVLLDSHCEAISLNLKQFHPICVVCPGRKVDEHLFS